MWPPFCKWKFQMQYTEWKLLNSKNHFTSIYPLMSDNQPWLAKVYSTTSSCLSVIHCCHEINVCSISYWFQGRYFHFGVSTRIQTKMILNNGRQEQQYIYTYTYIYMKKTHYWGISLLIHKGIANKCQVMEVILSFTLQWICLLRPYIYQGNRRKKYYDNQ